MSALLQVQGLTLAYGKGSERVQVLSEVSFSLAAGQALGLVGESGSGKSQTALAIMGLLPSGAQVGGSVSFDGKALFSLNKNERRALAGARMAMIFQDPMTSLNPYLRIGVQMTEMLVAHKGVSMEVAQAEAVRMLEAVKISRASTRLAQYPHEFSGGMRQRVMIAMMLMLKPALLIADEPTTALDVTVQAQILRLLAELRRDFSLSLLMISHDLGVIAEVAERVMVLYGGMTMEQGPTHSVLQTPQHPYTQALIAARPSLRHNPLHALPTIPGLPPKPKSEHKSCPFLPRCSGALSVCHDVMPPWTGSTEHGQLCHRAVNV